jgi:hypothetical protein
MNVYALKAALTRYSGPQPIDPNECVYLHTYENGVQEYITYAMAAEGALERIKVLEDELQKIFTDPWIKDYRQRAHRK